MRFHSLPGSKRYPETEDQYATVLSRYNTVLEELFAGQDVYVISPDWNEHPVPDPRPIDHERWHPGARFWTSVRADPGSEVYTHLYVSRVRWKTGCVDVLLRAVADDRMAGVVITDELVRRVHHPYDGGADVLLADRDERDRMRERHRDWLSAHPLGL
ncbi:hypothetical protein FNH05_08655 [Amycolatopsis rhizosphaerae]|uniref:DUF3885 domain-containing protein n=1 Tax=Amycolatopsis rhizosphaerae TaxID=2053003 RepID=A0A558D541_9PSEU|nr:hypothetical protein FNH05_08655 [Amycolatopsis rhizosphaerae]